MVCLSEGMTLAINITQMKRIILFGIITSSLLVTACSSKKTLDRSVVEGYNQCVAAVERAGGERARARAEALKSDKFYTDFTIPRDCKSEYGIPFHMDIADYKIIN